MNTVLRRALKVLLWVVGCIIALVILIAVAINIPAVQNAVKNQAVKWLKKKTNTEVRLDYIGIQLPKDVVLKGLYLEDRKHDTLVYAERLAADIDLFKILKNTIELNRLELQGVRANVMRVAPDTVFNYQFLADAFAGEQKKPDTNTKESGLKFNLDKLQFTDVGVRYRDDVVGNDGKVYFGNFDARVTEFDLKNQRYALSRLLLQNANINYLQQKPMVTIATEVVKAVNEAVKKPVLPVILVNDLRLEKVKLNFNDKLSNTKVDAGFGLFGFKNLGVDLNKQQYKGDELRLDNTNLTVSLKPEAAKKSAGTDTLHVKVDTGSTEPSKLAVLIKRIRLNNNNIKFDNLAAGRVGNKMDFNHLAFTGFGINADSLAYAANKIQVKLNNAQVAEQSGFKLQKLSGDIKYTDKEISLKNFKLVTPNTALDAQALVTYASLADLTNKPQAVQANLKINNSKIALRDVQYFTGAVPANYLNTRLTVNADALGRLNDLNINKLRIAGLKQTLVDINGTVKGLPDAKKLNADLAINALNTTKADIMALLPPKTLPGNIELPNIIRANGVFKGGTTNFNTRINLATDMGRAKINARVQNMDKKPAYNAAVNMDNINVGRLIKNNSIGTVTADVQATGSGKTAKELNVDFSAWVKSAWYNKYTYRNLRASGTYKGQVINVKAAMPDSNANFNLTARVNMTGKYPALAADVDLKRIDLQKLNFYGSELKLAGKIKADFSSLNPDYLNGKLDARSLQVAVNGNAFSLDTVTVNAVNNTNGNSLTLRSDIADADVTGRYQLTRLGDAITKVINKYYAFGTVKRIPEQDLNFTLKVKNPKYITHFVPALTELSPTTISGKINTMTDSVYLAGIVRHIKYGDYTIDSLDLNAGNKGDSLAYKLNVAKLLSPSIKLYNSTIQGTAADNKLQLDVLLRDNKMRTKYEVAGLFESINKNFRFSLNPDKLLLAYERWQVSNDNFVQFGKAGIQVNNLIISNGGQSLNVNSTMQRPNAPIDVKFTNFQIETLTRLAEQDTALVGGTINGTATAQNLQASPKFLADLVVDHLKVKESELGTLRLNANNNQADVYQVDAALTGVHNVRVNGEYATKSSSPLNFKVYIDKIDVKNLEALSSGAVRRGKGTLTGNFDITGSTNAPAVTGQLNFNNAGLNVKMINSDLDFGSQSIYLTKEGVSFNNFTVKDSLGQPLTVNGKILTNNFKDYAFNLNVKANKFRAMNSTAEDNKLFYGTLFISANADVKGDLNKPNVRGRVSINDNTKFYFALPNTDPAVIEQDGIVEFYDADAVALGQEPLNAEPAADNTVKGMDLSLNVSIDPDAELNVVVDPANGDTLRVKGEAELNASLDPSGKTSLTGTYTLSDGGYNLSVGGLTKKEFKIKKGSTVTWTGEPTIANVNLTAVYNVNAAPIDLLANQIQALDQVARNQYKQKFPFIVNLIIQGELMKPEINFQLDMREQDKGAFGGAVWTKIQQVNSDVNERNKQTFALLALDRFISENPFESLAGGTSVTSMARQSVSKLLTEQLNNLASDLIQGVDVEFGLNSADDYSTGKREDRTTLDVALSKRLLDDRLTITVGSSFGIEGPQPNNGKTSNIAGDINIEYLLSRDGRYRLRAYRRNQTDAVLQGFITETGVGFSIVVDYNRFKNVFKRLEREQKRRQNEKQTTGRQK